MCLPGGVSRWPQGAEGGKPAALEGEEQGTRHPGAGEVILGQVRERAASELGFGGDVLAGDLWQKITPRGGRQEQGRQGGNQMLFGESEELELGATRRRNKAGNQ